MNEETKMNEWSYEHSCCALVESLSQEFHAAIEGDTEINGCDAVDVLTGYICEARRQVARKAAAES